MKMSTAIMAPRDVARQIVEALAGGLQAAADVYRRYLEAGGDPMALRPHVPMSADLWRTLDDVAAGRIDTRTLCLPGRAASAIRALPKTTQTEILDGGVDILAIDGSTIRVPVAQLTAAQTAQAFGPNGLRAASEQAAWLKAQVSPAPPPTRHAAQFEVKRGRLVIYEPVELSMSDLHRILAQMG